MYVYVICTGYCKVVHDKHKIEIKENDIVNGRFLQTASSRGHNWEMLLYGIAVNLQHYFMS